MKVKVKEGQTGFYGGQLRHGGDEFELEFERHFSSKWMLWEKKPRAKPGPKPKAKA